MIPKQPTKRTNGVANVKLLVAAAALVATLSGWATFAQQQSLAAGATSAEVFAAPPAASLRYVAAPVVSQTVRTAPAPVTVTRSSR